MNDFQNEWVIIHSDIEKYERFSLIIKLFTVFIFILAKASAFNPLLIIFLILILWLQDGIWKTFQKRLETKILIIEDNIDSNSNKKGSAFQLYSEWHKNRTGSLSLIKEYIFNSLKPTVAYPYIALVTLLAINLYNS
ncbi:MAG: hypothetical protein GQ475_07120 [Methylococcaceae bacterium]|nr:hypothetical protein [Methylococcaceae bacterium]